MEPLQPFERHKYILNALESDGFVNVNKLSEDLKVTKVTVRSDLENLELRGMLVKTRGGAVLPEDRNAVRYFQNTIKEHAQLKEAIAKEASAIVRVGNTVILDSGSTTAIIARRLKHLQLTIITNSFPVIQEFSTVEHTELIVSGGVMRRPDFSLVGGLSRTVFNEIRADILFLGANGFCLKYGITCANIMEGQTKREMIKSAKLVCLVADSTKTGKVALVHVCDWDVIDVLITDTIDPDYRKELTDRGIQILTPQQ